MNKNFSSNSLISPTDFSLYREYWENSRNTISSVSRKIESRLIELEKHSYQFDQMYHEIESALSTLSVLYAKSGGSDAQDFILKMRSHVREHRTQIGKQQIAFNVVHYLHEKIREYEEIRFSKFPDIISEENEDRTVVTRCSLHNENHQFKWVSFLRNGSWFISPYDSLEFIPYRVVPFIDRDINHQNTIEFKGNYHTVTDLLARSRGIQSPDPSFYVLVKHKGTHCFAADKKGKRFLSSNDFISKKIEPFYEHVSRAKGFVSLAGTKYIYLNLGNNS